MPTAGNLQTDAAGQKFAGPVDPSDGTGKAPRGANIDETEGYADAQVALMDHANANLDKADDAAVTLGTVRVLPVGMLADEAASDSVDEGDIGLPRMSTARVPLAAICDKTGLEVTKVDDAAFTVGTSIVLPTGMLADESSADQVDEGDVALPRMSLSRVPLAAICDKTGLEVTKVDDAAFTPGTSIVLPIGAMADETAPDSVDEGDLGIPRMTLNRLLRVIDTNLAGNNRAYRAKATLMAEATVTTDRTTNETASSGWGGYKALAVLLTLSAKTMDASTTFDVYVQTSPDDGTTWDDIAHFSQVTNAALGNGTYVLKVLNDNDAGFVDRATRDGAIAANNIADYFCDQIRVKTVSVNFSGSDTLTVKVEAVGIG